MHPTAPLSSPRAARAAARSGELTGNTAKLDSFIEAIDRSLILETVRTGVCGIGRGDRVLKV